jgi:dTMP kinase
MSAVQGMAPGGLIAVSGIDGSGKSTLVGALAQSLRASGATVETVAALKSSLFSPLPWVREINVAGSARAPVESWLAGYFALVLLHNVATVIVPAMSAGTWIITDRWSLDHHANQVALGVDMAPWVPLLRSVPTPTLHLFLDLPVEVAQERIDQRGEHGIGAGYQFLNRCRTTMRNLANSADYSPVVVIEAASSRSELLDHALDAVGTATSGRIGAR